MSEMSGSISPEALACERIERLVDDMLQNPDYTRTCKAFNIDEQPYKIRLTSDVYEGDPPPHSKNSKRISISNSYTKGVLFSVELNALEAGIYDGANYPDNDLASFLRSAALVNPISPWVDIKKIYGICQQLDKGGSVDPEDIETALNFFKANIDQGSTNIIKARYEKLGEHTGIGIITQLFTGSAVENWGYIYKSAFPLKLSVKTPDKKVLLTRDHSGNFETSIEDPDFLKAMITYALPGSVLKDKEGNVGMFMVDPQRQAAAQEAERAAGIRGLDIGLLNYIEAVLRTAV